MSGIGGSVISASVRGSRTLAAGFFAREGKACRVTATGTLYGAAGASIEVTLTDNLGDIFWQGTITANSGLGDYRTWTLEAWITCYTTGASGKVVCDARMLVGGENDGECEWWGNAGDHGTINYDTTAAATLDLQAALGNAGQQTCGFQCKQFFVETLD